MRPNDLIHFCPPARVILGCGSRSQLPALLARLGYRTGVLITDTFFSQKTPWVNEYIKAAEAVGILTIVYDGGKPDPTTTLCDDATSEIRLQLQGRQLDHVIALGGGSNIDLAKALCVTLPDGQPVRQFVGALAQAPRALPLIALPTTAGTGSEATPGAILIDPSNATKVAVMDNTLRPVIALIDPEFTYTCPPRVTADAGIDALTHALESYLTMDSFAFDRGGQVDPGYSGRSSLTMLFAREAIDLCARFLLRTYHDGSDQEARIGMAYASHYAALSYGGAGLNAVHGIAYAVAGITHQSHGSTNAVLLPYVLDALRVTRRNELLTIARLFGIEENDEDSATRQVPVVLRALVKSLGIPTDLKSFGIQHEQLGTVITDALAVTRLAKAFPSNDTAADYAHIVEAAWHGRLEADFTK
ncbi:iron-containing alcohol dehydrogenase [Oxalicibacterium faecigallinarum]|uniref:Alcohol dehydrogenase n=1 Tax=Oxalicibacterium faecigallinarum TaxID=573741 RepID=A0A8J3AUA6_9BURK|nr:iron-containing alcohol dehydrogenase [Oxalicibacterium faecigallinarum]GGI20944.1 alcohol dehydrogenase [Oxalicibacterium faecigallinarum]